MSVLLECLWWGDPALRRQIASDVVVKVPEVLVVSLEVIVHDDFWLVRM